MSKTREEWFEFSKNLPNFICINNTDVFKFGENGTLHFTQCLSRTFLDEISEIVGYRCFFKI